MRDDFCAFILTHGRPSRVYTHKTMKRGGYSGKMYLVVDDEDKALPEYKERYGDDVLVFSKDEIAKTFDLGDNFHKKKGAIIFARNACFDLARKVGCKYFIQLDDDYVWLSFRFNGQLEYQDKRVQRADDVLSALVDFYEGAPFASVAMAQGGDFMGGSGATFAQKVQSKRKAMNTFICSVDRPFKFVGRVNEDVNSYTGLQRSGLAFLTVNQLCIVQKMTQKNAGGMTDLYKDSGTYVKSFYSVMYAPSCVTIVDMGFRERRIHHQVSWDACAPKIVRESLRKR